MVPSDQKVLPLFYLCERKLRKVDSKDKRGVSSIEQNHERKGLKEQGKKKPKLPSAVVPSLLSSSWKLLNQPTWEKRASFFCGIQFALSSVLYFPSHSAESPCFFLFCVNYRVIKLLSGLVHYRKPVVNLPSAIFGNGFENATELDELITSAPPLPLSMNASQSGRDSRQKTFSSSLYLSLIPRKGKTVLE